MFTPQVTQAPATKQIGEMQMRDARRIMRHASAGREPVYSLLLPQYQVWLPVPKNGRTLLGRDLPSHEPVIDLTPYEAHENGVSRLHAALYRMGEVLAIADMGSSNGTFVNDRRISPQQPHILCAGDVVRLGNLAFSIELE